MLSLRRIDEDRSFDKVMAFLQLIGAFAIYRMRIRDTENNPDSQFTAMPQTITPTGMGLNPSTEPIEEPTKVENIKENIN